MNAVTNIGLTIGLALLLASVGATAEDAATQSPADQKAELQQSSRCLKETGSRIKPAPGQPCINAAGQAYTREDIERTGATTTAEALRKLSPPVH